LESLFRQNLLLILEVVDDLNSDLIRRPENVKGEYLLPDGVHAIGPFDDLGVLDLLRALAHLLVDQHFDHGLEACGVKKLIVELPIHNVESKGTPFHDGDAVDAESRISLLKLPKFHLHLIYFLVH
jgi:hypothetical protein